MFNILGKCSPAQRSEQSLINQYLLIDLFAVFNHSSFTNQRLIFDNDSHILSSALRISEPMTNQMCHLRCRKQNRVFLF